MREEAEGLTVGHWELAKDVSEWIEVLAVCVIAASVVIAVTIGVRTAFVTGAVAGVEAVKRQVGRGLLLGLDLLIAADIIRTVTLQPTLKMLRRLVSLSSFERSSPGRSLLNSGAGGRGSLSNDCLARTASKSESWAGLAVARRTKFGASDAAEVLNASQSPSRRSYRSPSSAVG